MEIKNGIIIDGVLHELKESKSKDCKNALFIICARKSLAQCAFAG